MGIKGKKANHPNDNNRSETEDLLYVSNNNTNEEKLKILLINGGCLDRTGVCLFTYQLAHTIMMAYPRCSVTVYFKRIICDRALQTAFEDDGVKIIAGNHSAKGTFFDKQNRDGVKKDLQNIFREHMDVVHIHSSVIGFTSLILREAKRAHIPVRISHAHGRFEESIIKRLIHNVLRAYIVSSSTISAGCSVEAGTYLYGRQGVHGKKWRRVPNAIETGKFAFNEDDRKKYRNEMQISDDQLLLGAVGYLEEVKNHTFLIDIMNDLIHQGVKCKLIILGDGSLRQELKEKIHKYSLDECIALYGKTKDVPGLLSAMDIYLMPSLSEGLPISTIEAQTAGLPCLLSDKITSEADVTPDVIHLPIDQGTAAWVKEIKKLYNQTISRDYSNRSIAQQVVANAGFDISSLKKEISEMYGLHESI